uniref:Uncharacterized protein n=1 Tax=Cajanus cajan TaxID=3821 RepID=A0A151RVA8_CAJCA|nr:hypothetical protein KK1_031937 [Cajanus cajan]
MRIFLVWQQQILATIRGLKLNKCLHEEHVPKKFESKEHEKYTLNDIEALLMAQEELFEKHKKADSNLVLANTVPSITKNLLSVSQFCRDNQVFFEFHANTCHVKQEHTKETLLEGKFSKGLYVFPKF